MNQLALYNALLLFFRQTFLSIQVDKPLRSTLNYNPKSINDNLTLQRGESLNTRIFDSVQLCDNRF